MNAPKMLHALASRFGDGEFTTTEARDALGSTATSRTVGNMLRAAIGRPVAYQALTIELRTAGFVYGSKRRWRFARHLPVVVPIERPADDGADLV